ncbi:hypothetical protein [Streptomyces diastatochromogenes]|uniref:hypothetical protein n=1 Tax=Streptomyces diastatochromogenes TaxID=42236 RepID=UPI003675C331
MIEEFDRLCEAAADGSPVAMLEMASLYDGEESAAWRRRWYERWNHLASVGGSAAQEAVRELKAAAPEGGARARYPVEPVVLAVVTVAVVPFVNALVTKAGEDGYSAARALVRWLFRRGREVELPEQRPPRRGEPRPDRLLIVEDPDPKLKMAIWLGVDTPDERLRALQDLDMGAVVDDAESRQAKVIQIRWDEVTRSWKANDQ